MRKYTDLFVTNSHEWIEFHEGQAIVGITNLTLKGVKQIKKLEFFKLYGIKKRGDVFAKIQFDQRKIEVRMPVEGKIIGINTTNLLDDLDLLLVNAETNAWLVKILVSQPLHKKGLLPYSVQQRSS